MITWAIIPVKPLRDSKSRLSAILSAAERATLTSQLLARTLDVLQDTTAVSRTLVVSRDPAALKIARRHGVSTFGEADKQEMNMALTRASHIAAAQKADCVLVLPADLPFVTVDDIEMMVAAAAPKIANGNSGYYYARRVMAICSDQNDEGTNALLVCPPTGFAYQYGPGSFRLHLAEAERLGMQRQIVHAPGIKFDLDTEVDWRDYLALRGERIQVTRTPTV